MVFGFNQAQHSLYIPYSLCILYLYLQLCFLISDEMLHLNQKVRIRLSSQVGQLQDTNTPILFDFTVCLDLKRENRASQTAFSYCVEDDVLPPELGLSFLGEEKIQVFHRGIEFTFQEELKIDTWYTVCLTWKNITRQLEVYVNGEGVNKFDTNTNDPLRGRGSLVLGSNRFRKAGIIGQSTNFVGELYNFQMWNYARSPNEMNDCSEGNVFSWTKELWNFYTVMEDNELRCGK